MHFEEKQIKFSEANKNGNHNPDLETRKKCDAFRQGLGANIEQLNH